MEPIRIGDAEVSIPQSQHFRNIVAIIFAMVTGVIVVGTIESIGHVLYPPPVGLELDTPAQMGEYIGNLPAAALLIVLAGWSTGIFSGCLLAGIIGFKQGKFCSTVYSLVFCSVVGLMLYQVPSPAWFRCSGLILLVPSAFAGWYVSDLILIRLQDSGTSNKAE